MMQDVPKSVFERCGDRGGATRDQVEMSVEDLREKLANSAPARGASWFLLHTPFGRVVPLAFVQLLQHFGQLVTFVTSLAINGFFQHSIERSADPSNNWGLYLTAVLVVSTLFNIMSTVLISETIHLMGDDARLFEALPQAPPKSAQTKRE